MLVGQVHRTVEAQFLNVGPVAVDEMQHQELTEHQVVSMMKTGPQHQQTLGHVAKEMGQGHGPALLGETRSDGHAQSSFPGMAWSGKCFHPDHERTCHL